MFHIYYQLGFPFHKYLPLQMTTSCMPANTSMMPRSGRFMHALGHLSAQRSHYVYKDSSLPLLQPSASYSPSNS